MFNFVGNIVGTMSGSKTQVPESTTTESGAQVPESTTTASGAQVPETGDDLIPCEFCYRLFPLTEYIRHLSGCEFSPYRLSKRNETPSQESQPSTSQASEHSSNLNISSHVNKESEHLQTSPASATQKSDNRNKDAKTGPVFKIEQHISHDTFNVTKTDSGYVLKKVAEETDKKSQETDKKERQPCPFCEEYQPVSVLDVHSEFCGSRPYECSKCHNLVLLDNKETHDQICHGKKPNESYSGAEGDRPVNNGEKEKGKGNSATEERQPCPFCEKYQPVSVLDVHSEFCGSRPYECSKCENLVLLDNKETHDQTCHGKKPNGSYSGAEGDIPVNNGEKEKGKGNSATQSSAYSDDDDDFSDLSDDNNPENETVEHFIWKGLNTAKSLTRIVHEPKEVEIQNT